MWPCCRVCLQKKRCDLEDGVLALERRASQAIGTCVTREEGTRLPCLAVTVGRASAVARLVGRVALAVPVCVVVSSAHSRDASPLGPAEVRGPWGKEARLEKGPDGTWSLAWTVLEKQPAVGQKPSAGCPQRSARPNLPTLWIIGFSQCSRRHVAWRPVWTGWPHLSPTSTTADG